MSPGPDPERPDPVDWALASRLARRFAGRDPLEGTYLTASLVPDFEEVTREAEQLVGEFTGLRFEDSPAHAVVLDRQHWVDVNIDSFRRTIEPFTTRVAERMAKSSLAPAGRRIAGAEVGVLMGFLGQRVLGQYDLLVPDDSPGASPDAVYYVGPNVLNLEKRFGFRPRDFRLWIALHEVTHRAQFRGVPWMKEYFLGLIEQTLGLIEPNPKRMVSALERAAESARRGRNPFDDGGLVSLFATPEQRAVLDEVQALMSLLEGHGNFVMDSLGREHVTGVDRMSAVLKARRESGGFAKQMRKAMGIEMKMRQYEVGQRFINDVEAQGGPGAINAAWHSPGSLPRLGELEDPGGWLSRVGAGAARA